MSETVKSWLTERLGIIIDIESDSFVHMVKSGYLIAHLLYSLHIINDEQLTLITELRDHERAFDYVASWLRNIDIIIDDETKTNIGKGKVSTAVNLLYTLHLTLRDSDKLYPLKEKCKCENRFQVQKVRELIHDSSDTGSHHLSKPLEDYIHVIRWHQIRYNNLIEKCKQAKDDYDEYVVQYFSRDDVVPTTSGTSQIYKNDSQNIDNNDFVNCSYDELKALENKVVNIEGTDLKKAGKILKKIQTKRNKQKEAGVAKTKMERILMEGLWMDIMKKITHKLESDIDAMMLTISNFEKQIATKVIEVREQKNVIMEKRKLADDEVENKTRDVLLEKDFIKIHEISDEKNRYNLETNRSFQLYKKIQHENLRLKEKRKRDECYKIVEDLIDIAVHVAQYFDTYKEVVNRSEEQKFENVIEQYIRNEFAALFVTAQPILTKIDELILLILEPKSEDIEEIYLAEMERHDAIHESYLKYYNKFYWPWKLTKVEQDCILTEDESHLGTNILEHVVFRLLTSKYPKPLPPVPPVLPKVDAAVCINNIVDSTVPVVLDKLLADRHIKIIHMEDAINYCLRAYKSMSKVEHPQTQFFSETDEAIRTLKKEGKKTTSEYVTDEDERSIPPFQNKLLQTPRSFPCEKIPLTQTEELGRLAYEILNLGEPLHDKFLVKMFVEYLKPLNDGLNGWVLINYPQNYEQAAMLEEALTAKSIPQLQSVSPTRCNEWSFEAEVAEESHELISIYEANKNVRKPVFFVQSPDNLCRDCDKETNNIEDIADLQFRDVQQNNAYEDKNARFRVSKLLTDHQVSPPISEYNTYLTAFIRIAKFVSCVTQESEEHSTLEQFYQNQNCLYILYYKLYDLPTIKSLAKLIVKDSSVSPKTSEEIFGDTVLYLENDFKQRSPIPGMASISVSKKKEEEEEPKVELAVELFIGNEIKKSEEKVKKGKPKKDKPKKDKGKKGKKSKSQTVVIVRKDKETQIPEEKRDVVDIGAKVKSEAKPGEADWVYVDVSIPVRYEIALATLWENIEATYVTSLKNVFFDLRILLTHYIPYLNYVKHYMNDFIARLDDKQTKLRLFQKIFNAYEPDFINDDEVKGELHHRISEFRESLWKLCDERMRIAEEQREAIISQDWTTKQTCGTMNDYIHFLKIEIDRCSDTLQLCNDYYTSMITKMPCQEETLKKTLLEFVVDFESNDMVPFSSFVKSYFKTGTVTNPSPFVKLCDSNLTVCLAALESYQKTSLDLVSKLENYFLPKGKRNKASKDKSSKGKPDKKLPKFTEPASEVKEVGIDLIAEWRCAIETEVAKTRRKFDAMKSHLTREFLEGLIPFTGKLFADIKNNIFDRYAREVTSVQSACDVFSRAVEEESKLQCELSLEEDGFSINPRVLLFEDPLPEIEPPVDEPAYEGIFTVQQLSDLVDILLEVAPQGIITEREFIYLLQDMIAQNWEDGRRPMVPLAIQQTNLKQFSLHFFGSAQVIDWKDFVLYNLCLQFPTEHELLDVRQQFREFDSDGNEFVYSYQYDDVTFWFEQGVDTTNFIRANKSKDLLYRMYKINDDTINYTALLLSFCKDENPIVGVAKALELSLGKYVCWQNDLGEAFKANLREKRQLEEQRQLDKRYTIETVRGIIDTIIEGPGENSNFEYCDAVEMYEMSYLKNISREQYEEVSQTMPRLLLDEDFANVVMGYEVEYNPPKIYYLPFDAVYTVLLASMPWHSTTQNIGGMSFRQKLEIAYESCRNAEFDNFVLTHEFLNSIQLNDLLEHTFTFSVIEPIEINY